MEKTVEKKKRPRLVRTLGRLEREILRKALRRRRSIEERVVQELKDETLRPEPTRIEAKPLASRKPCPRQAFTTREVAEKFIVDMSREGRWKVVRCTDCGLLHVDE